MEKVNRKNYWRRLEAANVRKQRVITGYVEAKYTEIYKECEEFYEMLNQKYPKRKDLRRTNEYLWMSQGISGKTVKKYYTRKPKGPPNKEVPSKSNMQLIIPLMKPPIETTEIVIESTPDNVIESRPDNVIESTPDNVIESTPDNVIESIPDSVFEEIMEGLRADPDLRSVFDDFDEFDIDINIEDPTQLERELMHVV